MNNISPVTQYVRVTEATENRLDPLAPFRLVPATGDVDSPDWDTGWGLRAECPAGGLWCCGDGLAGGGNIDASSLKNDPTGPTPLQFKPFIAYQVSGCNSGTSRLQSERAAAEDNSRNWLDANINGWITQALEVGVCGNVGLTNLTDVSTATAQDLGSTIATLIRNRRQLGIFDRPTLHIPDWYAPVVTNTDWLLHVANVVLGPGYGTHSSVAAPAGEAWVYITGTVEYSLGTRAALAVRDDDLGIRRQNRSWELDEQLAVYRFDPCAGFKARVKVC